MTTTGFIDSPSQGIQLGYYWTVNCIIGAIVVLVVDLVFKKVLKVPIKFMLLKPKFNKITLHNIWKTIQKIDSAALSVAIRITLTLLIITLINHSMSWDYLNLQAVIAGIISSCQLTSQKANQVTVLRLSGILLGTFLALIYVLILLAYPSSYLEIFFIVATLTLCIFLSEKFPYLDYVFLHLGIIIPLILIHPATEQYNLKLALYRAVRSIEGGVIGALMQWAQIITVGSRKLPWN